MNATCERCSALFETSSERPSRYCSTCRELVRAEEQRIADSGGRGLIWGGWLVIISTVLNSVLGYFNLADILPAGPNFQSIPEDVKNLMFVGFGCVALLTLIPTVFMIVGGSALRRFSSRGFVITGAVFTFLMVGWFSFSLIAAVLGVAIGNNDELRRLSTASIIRAVILHVLEVVCIVFWIIAGIRALRILGRPEISRIFNAKAHERLYPGR